MFFHLLEEIVVCYMPDNFVFYQILLYKYLYNRMNNLDNNETKWKTKTFSKDNNNIVENLETISKKNIKNDENKETEIIIQKIKKINNKKKHANYKNIEELDNIYEETSDKKQTKNEKKETTNEEKETMNDKKQTNNEEKDTIDEYDNTKSIKPENFKENEEKEEKEGFKEDLSNRKCKQNAVSTFFSKVRYYIGLLNRLLFGNIDRNLSNIIGAIYNLGDKRSRTRAGDINIIKNQAYYILSSPVTLLVTYNWFFITVYRDAGSKINTTIDLDPIQSFLPMLNFFFFYLSRPTAILNTIILGYIPTTIDTAKKFRPMDILLNSMLLFLLMIFILSNVVCNYSSTIKNTLFGYFGGSTKQNPSLTNLLYGIILFSMLMSLFPSSVLDTASSLFNLVTAPFSTLIGGIFKLIFTLINIGIAGIFLLTYIIIHSFFAIPIYSNATYLNTIKNINKFLCESISDIGKYDCPPNTLVWWVALLKFILEIIYKCLYEFIFVLFFSIGIITYLLYVRSPINKIFFSFINMLIIGFISIFAYGFKIKGILEQIEEAKLNSIDRKICNDD